MKQFSLGLSKLKEHGLFVFRFEKEIPKVLDAEGARHRDSFHDSDNSGDHPRYYSIFDEQNTHEVHFRLTFWFFQAVLSLFRGVSAEPSSAERPHARSSSSISGSSTSPMYIAVYNFNRKRFVDEQWQTRFERIIDSIKGVISHASCMSDGLLEELEPELLLSTLQKLIANMQIFILLTPRARCGRTIST